MHAVAIPSLGGQHVPGKNLYSATIAANLAGFRIPCFNRTGFDLGWRTATVYRRELRPPALHLASFWSQVLCAQYRPAGNHQQYFFHPEPEYSVHAACG